MVLEAEKEWGAGCLCWTKWESRAFQGFGREPRSWELDNLKGRKGPMSSLVWVTS